MFKNTKKTALLYRVLEKSKQVIIFIIIISIILPQSSWAFDPSGYWWIVVNNQHEELIYVYIQSQKISINNENKLSKNYIIKNTLRGTWDKPDGKIAQIVDGGFSNNGNSWWFKFYQPWNKLNGTVILNISLKGFNGKGFYGTCQFSFKQNTKFPCYLIPEDDTYEAVDMAVKNLKAKSSK